MFIIENAFIRTKSTKNLRKNKNLINFSKENRKAGILWDCKFFTMNYIYITFSVIRRRKILT